MEKIINNIKSLTEFYILYLFIGFLLLVDVYSLHILKIGILDLDINKLLTIEYLKHLIFMLLIYGILNNSISSLIYVLLKKACYKLDKKNNNYKENNDILELSIDEKDAFLYNYAKSNEYMIKRKRNNYKTIYSLALLIIISIFIKGSLVEFLFKKILSKGIDTFFVLLLIIPILGLIIIQIKESLTTDVNEVYYKEN